MKRDDYPELFLKLHHKYKVIVMAQAFKPLINSATGIATATNVYKANGRSWKYRIDLSNETRAIQGIV